MRKAANLFAALLLACSAAPRPETPTVVLPGPGGSPPPLQAAADPPVDEARFAIGDLGLNAREKATWWKFMGELYSPCPDQAVSIAQCVDEKRGCVACVPAAKLLAAKVKEGATAEQLQTLYGERFGPNVKQVDLTGSPAIGPERAPVTVVEWFDFECPHCKMALPMLEKLEKKFEGNVRLVKKFYPLRSHTRAEPAARAAIAAMNQGKFWEMERTIFEHQDALEDTDLMKYATDLKLDMRRFSADVTSSTTDALLKRDRDEADRDGLGGTPFILINGREFDLALFHLESDLEPWIASEIEWKRR